MSFLDFYEKVQDRFSYEGARELYSFLKEMGVTSNLVELSEKTILKWVKLRF